MTPVRWLVLATALGLAGCGEAVTNLRSETPVTPGSGSADLGIRDGQPASDPNVVEFYTPIAGGGFYVGTGLVLSPSIVLTAGHVVQGTTPGKVVNNVPSNGTVVNANGQYIEIQNYAVHPDYASGADIALVQLKTPINGVSTTLSTAALTAGQRLINVGYGRDGNTAEANEGLGTKRWGSVIFKGYEAISAENPGTPNIDAQYPNGYMLFGPDPNSQTVACEGDSGGPVLLWGGGPAVGIFIRYHYWQTPGQTACQSTFQDTYVSIAAFKSWIDRTTERLESPIYAALAYSWQTGQVGTAWNYSDGTSADSGAAYYCGSASCQVLLTLDNNCGAFVIGSSYSAWYSSYSTTDGAVAAAMQACTSSGASGCTARAQLCANGQQAMFP